MERKSCPVCGNTILDTMLTLHKIPYFVNCLCEDEISAEQSGLGTQSVAQCRKCGFIFNQAFEPQKMKYGLGYHAERGGSVYYKKHLQDIAEQIDSVKKISEANVLEVACSTGEFLKVISEYDPKTCVGVDPSGDGTGESYIIRQTLFNEGYLKQYSEPIDLLISRHMIEHIKNPLEMLRFFAQALAEDGALYLETPRLDWILENRVFYDFTYEHCSYYTDEFMERLLCAAGFSVIQMVPSYGGQYFSILARKVGEGENPEIASASSTILNQVKLDFTKVEDAYLVAKNIFSDSGVHSHFESYPIIRAGVYLWGASGKGVMCCNLLGKDYILGCIDKNPFKAGKYIPGSGHMVIAPKDIPYKQVECVLVENDVYFEEIKQETKQIDPRIQVLKLNAVLGIGKDFASS